MTGERLKRFSDTGISLFSAPRAVFEDFLSRGAAFRLSSSFVCSSLNLCDC